MQYLNWHLYVLESKDFCIAVKSEEMEFLFQCGIAVCGIQLLYCFL